MLFTFWCFRILNPPKESHNKTDKQWQKGSLEREDYFAKLLESKDVEILRMQTALHNKMHQTKIVEELRKQLELQSRDFEKLVREKEALVPLVKSMNLATSQVSMVSIKLCSFYRLQRICWNFTIITPVERR